MLYRSGAHETMVGPKRLQSHCVENGSAAWRQLSLRPAISQRTTHVGQVRLSRNRPAGKVGAFKSFSEEKGGTTRHPGHESWPLQMLSTFTFEDLPGGKTKFTVRWAPYNATEAEVATFDSNRNSMTQGWSGTFEQLDAYLAKAA